MNKKMLIIIAILIVITIPVHFLIVILNTDEPSELIDESTSDFKDEDTIYCFETIPENLSLRIDDEVGLHIDNVITEVLNSLEYNFDEEFIKKRLNEDERFKERGDPEMDYTKGYEMLSFEGNIREILKLSKENIVKNANSIFYFSHVFLNGFVVGNLYWDVPENQSYKDVIECQDIRLMDSNFMHYFNNYNVKGNPVTNIVLELNTIYNILNNTEITDVLYLSFDVTSVYYIETSDGVYIGAYVPNGAFFVIPLDAYLNVHLATIGR